MAQDHEHGHHGHEEHRVVRIHIDRQRHESPNPTTGEALYALGNVMEGYHLYREVDGDKEDKPIRKDGEHLHLTEDEHFYSAHTEYEIVVNGRAKKWAAGEISFDQVVALAYETPPTGANVLYTVLYHKGAGHEPDGILVAGGTVKVKNGMIFNVTPTDRS